MSLKLSSIYKKFGNKVIFENFSYEFSKAGIYALVGNSGVGKTTLLRMIAGLDTAYEGNITDGGIKNTAFAFQEYRLFPNLSAIENLTVANGNHDDTDLIKRGADLLIKLGFTKSDLDLFPAELSGGMKQRVSLARALLRDTPILLLDEPTKELDEGIREKLYGLIKEEGNKRLVIVVSHHIEDFENLNAIKINI